MSALAQNFGQFCCVPLARHIGGVKPTVVQHGAAIRKEDTRGHAQRSHAHDRKGQRGNGKQTKQTSNIRRSFGAGRDLYGVGT